MRPENHAYETRMSQTTHPTQLAITVSTPHHGYNLKLTRELRKHIHTTQIFLRPNVQHLSASSGFAEQFRFSSQGGSAISATSRMQTCTSWLSITGYGTFTLGITRICQLPCVKHSKSSLKYLSFDSSTTNNSSNY